MEGWREKEYETANLNYNIYKCDHKGQSENIQQNEKLKNLARKSLQIEED